MSQLIDTLEKYYNDNYNPDNIELKGTPEPTEDEFDGLPEYVARGSKSILDHLDDIDEELDDEDYDEDFEDLEDDAQEPD